MIIMERAIIVVVITVVVLTIGIIFVGTMINSINSLAFDRSYRAAN